MSQAQVRSKQPANPLAGPYGHPFHAIAVTVPIGAWTASIVFDILAFATGDASAYAAGSRVLILIGIIGAALAGVLGLMDLTRLEKGTPARRTALTHAILNVAGLAVWIVNLLIRQADPDTVPVLGFVLSIVAFLALGVSGWLGGKLAYRYGVRVADEGTQAEGFRRG